MVCNNNNKKRIKTRAWHYLHIITQFIILHIHLTQKKKVWQRNQPIPEGIQHPDLMIIIKNIHSNLFHNFIKQRIEHDSSTERQKGESEWEYSYQKHDLYAWILFVFLDTTNSKHGRWIISTGSKHGLYSIDGEVTGQQCKVTYIIIISPIKAHHFCHHHHPHWMLLNF